MGPIPSRTASAVLGASDTQNRLLANDGGLAIAKAGPDRNARDNMFAYVLHSASEWSQPMKYTDLVEGDATETEKQEYLVDGEMIAITIRIPKNLRDAGKEAAALKGVSFSAYVRMCMLEDLVTKGR